MAESLPQLRTTAQLVRDKLIRGDIRPEELFRAYMLENAEPFEAWAKEAPDAPNLLPFLVYNSMEPWLEAAGEALPPPIRRTTLAARALSGMREPGFHRASERPEPSRNEGRDINKGGKRMHTCSYCRTTFRAKRIQCPFCLEEDAKKLDYFTTENEPGYQFMSAARARAISR